MALSRAGCMAFQECCELGLPRSSKSAPLCGVYVDMLTGAAGGEF